MKLRLVAAICALALIVISPAEVASAGATPLYYLSLGDSVAAGTQPGLFSTNESYTDQLYAELRVATPSLRHVKLACPGETTASMITAELAHEGRTGHSACRYPHGSQLAEAVSFLRAHRPFVALVTIDIGANDVLSGGGVPAIAANLPVILGALREAAGPSVPIIGMNYYDPLLVTWFSDPASLAAEVARAVGFNNFLETIYGGAGVPVADVEAAFFTTDMTLVGGVPRNVATICVWTWMCSEQDIHPNSTGYHVIALAFKAKL